LLQEESEGGSQSDSVYGSCFNSDDGPELKSNEFEESNDVEDTKSEKKSDNEENVPEIASQENGTETESQSSGNKDIAEQAAGDDEPRLIETDFDDIQIIDLEEGDLENNEETDGKASDEKTVEAPPSGKRK
jgi:hypothetical protein